MIRFSLPGRNPLGPNEYIVLDDLHNGTKSSALCLNALAKVTRVFKWKQLWGPRSGPPE